MKRNILTATLTLALLATLIPLPTKAATIQEPSGIVLENQSLLEPPHLFSKETSFSWKLDAQRYKTKPLIFAKNTTIVISATLSSSSARARIGIIDPDGTYHTQTIKGYGSYSYTFPSAGTYEILCRNLESYTYTATINYTFK